MLTVTAVGGNHGTESGSAAINIEDEYIVIEVSTYFYPEEFKVGDTIIFNNYDFSSNSTSNINLFNDFINRLEGHKIIDTGKSSASTILHNLINIPSPAIANRTNGNITDQTSWYTSFKGELNGLPGKANGTFAGREDSISGKLINVSVQNNIKSNQNQILAKLS